MTSPQNSSESAPGRKIGQWARILLVIGLLAGLWTAAWQAMHRSDVNESRDLTIIGPETGTVLLDGQASRIPVAEGVHAFSVTPGDHRVELVGVNGPKLAQSITVPPGIGPVMIELRADPDGALVVGYY